MIYNKSGHPIEVKKISVRIWSLRDEIEAALGRRMKECEAAGIPLYIDDIKAFYHLQMKAPRTQTSNVLALHQAEEDQDEISSLMESLNEDEAEAPQTTEEEAPESSETSEENQKLSEAEGIIAQQAEEGLETSKPNPILERPFQRQPPDLDKISYGFSLLSDINMETFLSFTKEKFLFGQSVVVEFLIPQNFTMTAEVSYCNYYSLRSRIISSTKPDYRLQCRFSFALPGERDTLRNFLKSIEPSLPQSAKKSKKESEDDSLGL
jgi:hypothetical protein